MSTPRLPALIVAALACQGCATIGQRPPSDEDTVVSTRQEITLGAGAKAQVTQEGARATLTATRPCALQEIQLVDRTTVRLVPRTSSGTSYQLGYLSAFMTVGGLALLGVAYTGTDTHATVDQAFGYPLTALGAAALTWVIYDATRPDGHEAVVERMEIQGATLQPDVPCRAPAHAAGNELVVGRIGKSGVADLPLGRTDADGGLVIDLAAAIPLPMLRGPEAEATLPVFIRGVQVGALRVADFARDQEALGWYGVEIAGCTEARSASACDAAERYLRDFPDGPHATEAREAVEHGKLLIQARRDVAAEEAHRQAAEDAKKAQKADAAAAAAQRGATAACQRICKSSCKGALDCVSACVQLSCP